MRVLMLLPIAALLLAGCDPTRPPVSAGSVAAAPTAAAAIAAAADSRLATFESRFHTLRMFAELLLPLLPADRATQVRAAADRVEKGLARLRAATTATERLFGADEVQRALDAYAGFTG